MVVDGRHPQCARGGDLGRLLLFLLTGDFDDQVQEVVRAAAVVEAGEEVGDVALFLAVQRIGMLKPRLWFFTYRTTSGMASRASAIFCSQESVSATTWEMWHLLARVA
jgi:hypothetical protein